MAVSWTAHLCGLCLALRDDHGQLARVATNYDGLVVSVLVEAQTAARTSRRTAGPCPLRAMRTAPVATGEGARLAAAVSLVLASAKVRDHIADRDGLLGRRPVAAAARRIADRWDRAGSGGGAGLGFDTAVLLEAVGRQAGLEALAGPGTPLLVVTEPTETATAAAFAHTAVLAGRPQNAAPLAEAGRLFGRLAHLLDAVEDLAADRASGAWNPITATGTTPAEARRLCDDAVRGVRLALRDVHFEDGGLAHTLLVHELARAVHRVFGDGHDHTCATRSADAPRAAYGDGGQPYGPGLPQQPYGDGGQPYGGGQQPYGPGQGYGGGPGDPYGAGNGGPPPGPAGFGGGYGPGGPADGYGPGGPGGGGYGGGPGGPGEGPGKVPPAPLPPRGKALGCAVWLGLCCTCQLCCNSSYPGPWSRRPRSGVCCVVCDKCDCDCDCCECVGGICECAQCVDCSC